MMYRYLTRIALLLLVTVAGCSTKPVVIDPPPQEPLFTSERLVSGEIADPFAVNDPLEGLNRTIYRFNSHADRYVLNPALKVYRFVFPTPVRAGVSNFFKNLFGIRTFANQLLQGRPVRALATSGRFALNTTLGLAGIFDVATHAGMPYYKEDFGQTLGVWGVGPGWYLVLPILGPSNVRDGIGTGVDAAFMNWLDPLGLEGRPQRQYAYYPLYVLDTRGSIGFQYHQTGSPFEYELVRRLIFTIRQIEVEK